MEGWMTSTEAREDSRGPDCIQQAPSYFSMQVCLCVSCRPIGSPRLTSSSGRDTGQALHAVGVVWRPRGRAISTEDSLEQLKKDARPDDRMQASSWNDASVPFSSPSRLDLCTPSDAFGCTVCGRQTHTNKVAYLFCRLACR